MLNLPGVRRPRPPRVLANTDHYRTAHENVYSEGVADGRALGDVAFADEYEHLAYAMALTGASHEDIAYALGFADGSRTPSLQDVTSGIVVA